MVGSAKSDSQKTDDTPSIFESLSLSERTAQSGCPLTTTAARSAYRNSRSRTSYPRTDSRSLGMYFNRSYSIETFKVPYTAGTSRTAAVIRIATRCRTVNRGIEPTMSRSRAPQRKLQPRPPQVL